MFAKGREKADGSAYSLRSSGRTICSHNDGPLRSSPSRICFRPLYAVHVFNGLKIEKIKNSEFYTRMETFTYINRSAAWTDIAIVRELLLRKLFFLTCRYRNKHGYIIQVHLYVKSPKAVCVRGEGR